MIRQAFDILWDQGCGRRMLLDFCQTNTMRYNISLITAWIREGALRETPNMTCYGGRTILHAFIIDEKNLHLRDHSHMAQHIYSATGTPINWKRVCLAGFYCLVFDERWLRRELDCVEKLILLMLKEGVNPLQKDNEGISVWDYVQGYPFLKEIIAPFAIGGVSD